MSVNLESASDIKVSGFGRAQNVTLRFYQSNPNYKYYRLKLTATGIAPMYIYLGEYVTNPQYVYAHSFSNIILTHVRPVFRFFCNRQHQAVFRHQALPKAPQAVYCQSF